MTRSPALPVTRRARLAVTVSAGVLGAGALAGGCGSPKATAPPTILDTEKVERAIEQSSLEQRGKQARVSCPSGVHQRRGLTFTCTAVVKKVTTEFVVTQLDNAGNVRYEAR